MENETASDGGNEAKGGGCGWEEQEQEVWIKTN